MGWFKTLRRALLGGMPTYDGVGFGRRTLACQVGNPGAIAAPLNSQCELRAKSDPEMPASESALSGVHSGLSTREKMHCMHYHGVVF